MNEQNIQNLPIDCITADESVQSRAELHMPTVEDYTHLLRDNTMLPPVDVVFEKSTDTYYLADGFHRYWAAIRAERTYISANIIPGTRRDAILFSVGSNHNHGLRRTFEDKRRAVSMLLNDEEWSLWSSRIIARRCGVSHTFVEKSREIITGNVASDNPESSERKFKTRHGGTSTMDTSRIGKRESDEEPEENPERSKAPVAPVKQKPAPVADTTPVNFDSPEPDKAETIDTLEIPIPGPLPDNERDYWPELDIDRSWDWKTEAQELRLLCRNQELQLLELTEQLPLNRLRAVTLHLYPHNPKRVYTIEDFDFETFVKRLVNDLLKSRTSVRLDAAKRGQDWLASIYQCKKPKDFSECYRVGLELYRELIALNSSPEDELEALRDEISRLQKGREYLEMKARDNSQVETGYARELQSLRTENASLHESRKVAEFRISELIREAQELANKNQELESWTLSQTERLCATDQLIIKLQTEIDELSQKLESQKLDFQQASQQSDAALAAASAKIEELETLFQTVSFGTPDATRTPAQADAIACAHDTRADALSTSLPITDNHENRKRGEKSARKTKSVLREFPADFTLTDDRREYALNRNPRMDVDREFDKFKSNHLAKGSRFKDWDQAWQTWVLRSPEFSGNAPASPARPKLAPVPSTQESGRPSTIALVEDDLTLKSQYLDALDEVAIPILKDLNADDRERKILAKIKQLEADPAHGVRYARMTTDAKRQHALMFVGRELALTGFGSFEQWKQNRGERSKTA